MSSSPAQRKRIRVARKRRKRIALILLASMLLVLTTCAKVILRTGINPPDESTAENEQPSGPAISLEQCEALGSVVARTLVAPPPNPIAAERYRDFERAARAVKRRTRQNSSNPVDDENEPRMAVVARKPFVLYVAITALVQFVLGFICAMQIGYQPVLFGKRISLSALDPFPALLEAYRADRMAKSNEGEERS